MAWTAPMTATLNQTFTAAQWNTHIRDNLAETEAGKATTRGRLFVSLGANSITEAKLFRGDDSSAKTTTSTSYTDLSGSGPAISNTIATGQTTTTVFWQCTMGNNTTTAASYVSVAVSGATTVAADDRWAIQTDGLNAASTATDNLIRMAGFHRFTGLTAGTNIFTMKYRVTAGTGFFSNRNIVAMGI